MPLDRLIFTPGQVPDYASMGFKAASLAPDLQAKFIAGQRAAQEQQMNQLKYQQEKQKADLFAAIAPELAQYQKAQLQAKLAMLNGAAVDPYAQYGGAAAFVPAGTINRGVATDGDNGPLTSEGAHDPSYTPPPFPYQPMAGGMSLQQPPQMGSGLFGTMGSQYLPTPDFSE